MNVGPAIWLVTIAGVLGLFVLDFLIVDRRPHEFTTRSALRSVVLYVAIAVAFGLVIGLVYGTDFAAQFFAGYVTEYSLSVDNLFVFMVIMSSFAVPKAFQHRVLLVGIAIALVLRTLLILVGAVVLARFSWAFFLFGAFLLFTAGRVWRGDEGDTHPEGNIVIRTAARLFPTTDRYHGTRMIVRLDGKRTITPMLLVIVAIGTTDLLFALDSIPAVFGLTKEAYIVFAVNAFALMGLRQLYFLLGGLLERLVYLHRGLAILLGLIGVKLILEALHSVGVDVPTVGTWVSLAVIVVVIGVTAATSLIAVKRNPDLIAEVQAEEGIDETLDFGKALGGLHHEQSDDSGGKRDPGQPTSDGS